MGHYTVNEVVKQRIESHLDGLRNDLYSWFADDLSDRAQWKVNGDRFEFPLPECAKQEVTRYQEAQAPYIESNRVALLLDDIRDAIWAYCAGCEFLRTSDQKHLESFTHYFAEWGRRKKLIQRARSSNVSQTRETKLLPGLVQKHLNDGKRVDQIAKSESVTVRAVRQCIKDYNLVKDT